MKKIIAMILCLIMVLSLAACGTKNNVTETNGDQVGGNSETTAAADESTLAEETTAAEEETTLAEETAAAPEVIRLTVSGAVVEGTYANALTIASIFGLEEEMNAKLNAYDDRIKAILTLAEGKTAIVGMCTGGSFNLLGNDGRCSIIGNELGFENIGVDAKVDTSTHGNEAFFEFVVQTAPDYIFVLDRDKATNAEGAQLAKDIMENELVMGTDAYKNGNLIIMENAGVWYKAEGGFTALGIMLSDLEAALGLN